VNHCPDLGLLHALAADPSLLGHVETRMHLTSEITLQVSQRIQVNSDRLRPLEDLTQTGCVHLPISAPHPGYQELSIEVLAGGRKGNRQPVPLSALTLMADRRNQPDELAPLLPLVVVPLSVEEADGFPVMTLHTEARRSFHTAPPTENTGRPLRIALSPVADVVTPYGTDFGSTLVLNTADEIDLIAIDLEIDLQLPAHLLNPEAVPLYQVHDASAPDIDATPYVKHILLKRLDTARDGIVSFLEWLRKIPAVTNFESHFTRLEELRGRVCSLSSTIQRAAALHGLRTVVDDLSTLASDLRTHSHLHVVLARGSTDTLTLPTPPCGVKRIRLAYSTVSGQDGSRRPWAAGTTASLVTSP
jgi:hypothetical protein